MTFESERLIMVAIYIWLPPASYVVFSDNSGYQKWYGFHIAHVYSLGEDLSHGTIFFDLLTLTLKFDLLLKNFNLGYNFLTRSDRAFILHMCIPCDKTFHMVPYFLTSWPWPWSLTYFCKTLTLAITFLPEVKGLSYCHMCIPCDKTFHVVP